MKSIFNESQQKAIELLAQGDKTYRQIATACNTTAETLRRWRKDPEFQQQVTNRCRELLKEMEPDLYSVAFQQVKKKGSWQHIRLLLDRIEKLDNAQQNDSQNFNITVNWKQGEEGYGE